MVKPMTLEEFEAYIPREFLLLIGHPGSGKSHTLLSIIDYWKTVYPESLAYVIDTEDGLRKIWKKHFSHLKPEKDIIYYLVSDIDEFLLAFEEIKPKARRLDWLCAESLSRTWEFAQDTGYQYISGMSKIEYFERRLAQRIETEKGIKLPPPIPQPDQFWQIVKHLQVRAFLDELQKLPCNILLTTTLGVEKPSGLDSAVRKEVRKFLGLSVSPDGFPRSPYYPDTVILLTKEIDGFYAQVLKDRGYEKEGEFVRFKINNFYLDLMANR